MKCNCDQCKCVNVDSYTKEGGTCEECFQECVETLGDKQ